MPFTTNYRLYTRADVLSLNPNQNGVYGLFSGSTAIYIGSGNIRQRLLDHLNGDNPCITTYRPNRWIAEVISGDLTRREGELIKEYQPTCNKVIPR